MDARSASVLIVFGIYWVAVMATLWYGLTSLYRGWGKTYWWSMGVKADFALLIPLLRFLVWYAVAGVALAVTFKMLTPAMTWRGMLYLAAIWPVWQLQTVTGYQPPIPDWVFSFEGF
jgi:hypothetical protein